MSQKMKPSPLKTLGAIALTLSAAPAWAAKVTSIDFKQLESGSEIRITADGPLEIEKTENTQDKQIVLDLKGSSLAKSASRKLDTSSFKSKVSLISPYAVSGQNDSRVVVQLRDAASVELSKTGNQAILTVSDSVSSSASAPAAPISNNKADAQAQAAPPPAAAASEPAPGDPSDLNESVALEPTHPGAPESGAKAANPKKGPVGTDALSVYDESKIQHRYIGKPITLQVRDMDLIDVFQLIGEASGFNVIVGSEVSGKITMSLVDTPWDQVLDLILQTRQLGAERKHNVLRITTLSNLTAEKQNELAAKKVSEQTAPRITRIFPISYAKLGDLVSTFTKFASVNSTATDQSSSTIVQADERTNSLIVRDTAENIERMRKLITVLDTQTPQVLIEGKVVEASSRFSSTIGGQLGLSRGQNSSGANFIGASANQASISGLSTVTSSANSGTIGASFGFIPGVERVNAVLALSEAEDSAKLVATPRVVVLNKESTTITASQPVAVQTTTSTSGGITTSISTQNANTALAVTPTVTNDSSVLLQVALNRDAVVTQAQTSLVAGRSMNTKVLVDSGSTLVIGGIYTESKSTGEGGVPYLRKLPILGTLFGSETESSEKTELFFFITPRILNAKESGLGTTGSESEAPTGST